MLHIAICDDDERAVCSHRKIAEECFRQCGCVGEIAAYTDSYHLLCDITEDDVIVEFGSNRNCRIPMKKAAIAEVEKSNE